MQTERKKLRQVYYHFSRDCVAVVQAVADKDMTGHNADFVDSLRAAVEAAMDDQIPTALDSPGALVSPAA